MRCVEKRDFLPGKRMDERREEGRLGMSQVKCEMFDMVTYSSEGVDTVSLGEGAGVEGNVDAGEEALCEKVAVGGGGLTQGANIGG